MNRTTKLAFWSASMLLSLGSLYACSSSSSDAGTGGGGDDKDATTSDGSSTSSGDSGSLGATDSGKGTGGADGGKLGDGGATNACAASKTAGDCYVCCDDQSDGGVEAYFNYQDTCLCDTKHCGGAGKKGACKNTYCKDPNTDDAGAACDTCIDDNLADDAGDAGCVNYTLDNCAADPSCAMGVECILDSKCDDIK
ncbi:MAG TPA: hypothetical protein VF407_10895 [Polyangiaceae bacterium]